MTIPPSTPLSIDGWLSVDEIETVPGNKLVAKLSPDAKQALLSLLLQAKPEKMKNFTESWGDGYNQALSDYEANIKELFK